MSAGFTERDAVLCETAAQDCDAVSVLPRCPEHLAVTHTNVAAEYRALAEKIRAVALDPDAERLTLRLPLPPNTANARFHWRTKEKLRSEYFARCDLLYAARMLPRAVGGAFVWERATVSAHLVLGQSMDEDNAMARCKWPLDWAVRKGYVRDDSAKHLKWAGLPTQDVRSTKTSHGITLTLTRQR